MSDLLAAANQLRWTIPFSQWTPLLGAVGIGLSLLVWRPLARLAGWRRWPALAALVALTLALAMTLSPKGGRGPRRTLAQCVPTDWADLGHSADRVGGSLESLLNIGLLLPLGFALVLASRRVVWPAALMVLLPAAIELTQTTIRGRECSPADWMANALGGLLGAALGLLVHRWWQARAAKPKPEPELVRLHRS